LQCLLADNATNAAGFWTPQENGALLSALLRYGDDWDQVAAALENKTKGECACVDMCRPYDQIAISAGYRLADVMNAVSLMHFMLQMSVCSSSCRSLSTSESPISLTTCWVYLMRCLLRVLITATLRTSPIAPVDLAGEYL